MTLRYPGLSALSLGGVLYSEEGDDIDMVSLPHKVSRTLERLGLIRRKKNSTGDCMICWITEQGVKEMAKYEKGRK